MSQERGPFSILPKHHQSSDFPASSCLTSISCRGARRSYSIACHTLDNELVCKLCSSWAAPAVRMRQVDLEKADLVKGMQPASAFSAAAASTTASARAMAASTVADMRASL